MTNATTKVRVTEGSPEEISTLYKTIKNKKRSNGERYTQAMFIDDLYLNERTTFHKWTSDPQQMKPTRQSIALMNVLAEKEGV